jgi:uncharacterized YccA/Bax inhibitor family protein
MANPLLNEKKANEVAAATQAGWGAPDPALRSTPIPGAPITDGPVSPWTSMRTMTVGGTATATGVLMVLLLGAAVYGWNSSETNANGTWNLPALAIVGILVGSGPSMRSAKASSWVRSRVRTTISRAASSCRPSAPRSRCSS